MTYQNHVLRQLERHCPEELVALERVQMEARDVLQTAAAEVTHALFPENGLLSLVCPSGSAAVELACLGCESMAPAASFAETLSLFLS